MTTTTEAELAIVAAERRVLAAKLTAKDRERETLILRMRGESNEKGEPKSFYAISKVADIPPQSVALIVKRHVGYQDHPANGAEP